MKKMFFSFRLPSVLALALCTLLMVSCSKKESEALSVIPKETPLVVTFDFKSIVEKADLKDNRSLEEMTKNLSNDPTLKSILEDPQKSGVDFDEVFLFITNDMKPALSCKLKDASKFTKTVEQMLQEESISASVKKENGISSVSLDDKNTLVWDDKKALLAMQQNSNDALALFSAKKENSILSNEDFSDFYKNKTDLSCWINNEKLINLSNALNRRFLGNTAETYTPEMQKALRGTYSHINLEFNKGNIRIASRTTPVERAKEMDKLYYIPTNVELLSFFPAESYLLFSGSTNISELMKLIEMPDEMPQEMNTVINSLKGNFVGSLYELNEGKMPLFAIGATVNDHQIFDLAMEQIATMSVPVEEKVGYTKFGMAQYQLFIGQQGDKLMLTSSEDLMTEFVANDPARKNLSNSSEFKAVKTDPAYFYMNLDIDTYPQWIKGLLMYALSPSQMEALSLLKDVKTTYDPSSATSTVILQLKTKENSLAAIIKALEKIN
jgi:hypothetical protein